MITGGRPDGSVGRPIEASRLIYGAVLRGGQRQRSRVEWAAARIRRHLEPASGILANIMHRITVIVRPCQQHDAGTGETAEVVDMAAGNVVDRALAKPDHDLAARVRAHCLFDLPPGRVAVAVRVEQTLLGGDQGAFAVGVDRSAFQHDRCTVPVGALAFEDLAGDRVVVCFWEITRQW